MAAQLDHLILEVKDAQVSADFRARARQWDPIRRLVPRGGKSKGPGLETGARGPGQAVYFFDPDRHLIEIRHYDA